MKLFLFELALLSSCQAFAMRRSLLGISCTGTFLGDDSNTYTCQHAIDRGWAPDCATVSGWRNAQCEETSTHTDTTELSGPNDNGATNLQACVGECDRDEQCASGLKCFQRDNGEAIPGCHGRGGGAGWDYCYDPNFGAASTPTTPTETQAACPGTFVGLDSNTYTCQHAIDNNWAPDCATVSGWNNAECTANGVVLPPAPSPPTSPPTSSSLTSMKVMSYNTEYRGYPNRVDQYGAKIGEVNAAVVGTQECQNRAALASASGYESVDGLGAQNPILYNREQVTVLSSGWMSIPRDDYAPRTITWGKFRHIHSGTDFYFFNTHLPHNHNEASSRNTHARIARMLLDKRQELGAGDMPTVVVGDCNPFASSGASEGSFESNLAAGGLAKAYQAQGNPGYGGLDKIFVSTHWTTSNGADQGTGSSDHPAIAVDVSLA